MMTEALTWSEGFGDLRCVNTSRCLPASFALGRRLCFQCWEVRIVAGPERIAQMSISGLLATAGTWRVNLKDSKEQVARPLHPGDEHRYTPSNRSWSRPGRRSFLVASSYDAQ
jgi:hypothetical protein